MSKPFFIIAIIAFYIPQLLCSQTPFDTVYVDPSSTGSNQGTIENPRTQLSKLTLTDSTVYFLKGDQNHQGGVELYGLTDIILKSYGGGKATISYCRIGDSKNITIKSLKINGSGQYSVGINAGTSENILFDSLEIFGSGTGSENLYYGIRGGHIENFKVLHCEFHHLRSDAIYMNFLNSAEFAYNYIHNINMSNGPGDGMQLSADQNNIYIHHNRIDRRGSTGKFCLVFSDNSQASNIRIENNHFSGPDNGNGGAAVFFAAPVPEPASIRWNRFENCPTGLYIHTNADVGHNLFIENGTGINNQTGIVNIGNNVFYGNGTALSTVKWGFVKNNIVYLNNAGQTGFSISAENAASNNMINIYNGESPEWLTVADPLFTSAENYDFHLRANSPAIDAGADINFDYDFEGNINHCNGLPDMGAFEFQQNCPEVQNFRPVVVAPHDTVLFSKDKLLLNLRSSYDQDDSVLSYHWQIPRMIDIVPYSNDQSVIAAYMPEIQKDTIVHFYAHISDGRLYSDTADITVTIKPLNTPPIAHAGNDISMYEQSTVLLDGSASFDPDGQHLKYFWDLDFPHAYIQNASEKKPTIYVSEIAHDTSFIVVLQVFDGLALSEPDSLTIRVKSTKENITSTTDHHKKLAYRKQNVIYFNGMQGISMIELIDLQGKIINSFKNEIPQLFKTGCPVIIIKAFSQDGRLYIQKI